MPVETTCQVEEKTVPPMRIAAIRMRGCYGDCGKGFARICRRFGRHATGKPFVLHHDTGYHPTDADFEACIPVRGGQSEGDIVVRDLPGCRCLSLLHHGPYPELGRSYERILTEAKQRGATVQLPTREIYLRGPGVIFRGNPKKYLTEIQLPIGD
jgi:effector-binding domain-containing protein